MKKWSAKEVNFLKKKYRKFKSSQIAEKLKRSESAVYDKAHKINLSKRDKLRLPLSSYKSSEDIAWLVGYLLGDGYLTSGWVIGMKSKDTDLKDFYIKKFQGWSKCGMKKFIISQTQSEYKDKEKGRIFVCKKIWTVRVCSKEAWIFLKKFKHNPLYSLKFFPKKYWQFILKGLWDAEGSIVLRKNHNGMVIGFCNSDSKILELYEKICFTLGFHATSAKGNRVDTINIYSIAETLNFVNQIGITTKRKRQKAVGRIENLKRKREIYYKIIRLKNKGLKRKQIWEEINGEIPWGTLDGWIYSDIKPYYIENAPNNMI